MGKYDEKEIVESVKEFDEEVTSVTKEDVKTVVLGAVSECAKLRLRREPVVADDNVIGELKFADVVYVDLAESTDDFYKVITEAGVEGYCMRPYINISEE